MIVDQGQLLRATTASRQGSYHVAQQCVRALLIQCSALKQSNKAVAACQPLYIPCLQHQRLLL